MTPCARPYLQAVSLTAGFDWNRPDACHAFSHPEHLCQALDSIFDDNLGQGPVHALLRWEIMKCVLWHQRTHATAITLYTPHSPQPELFAPSCSHPSDVDTSCERFCQRAHRRISEIHNAVRLDRSDELLRLRGLSFVHHSVRRKARTLVPALHAAAPLAVALHRSLQALHRSLQALHRSMQALQRSHYHCSGATTIVSPAVPLLRPHEVTVLSRTQRVRWHLICKGLQSRCAFLSYGTTACLHSHDWCLRCQTASCLADAPTLHFPCRRTMPVLQEQSQTR